MIPYGRQDICESDIDAVIDVLKSDFLTQGPRVPDFEKSVATKVGASHAVAVNSATSALHIACLALGLKPGDRLWTSPISFVASANCGLYCGAIVDFVDIDPETYNMSPVALEKKLQAAEADGTLPKVVVPVDMCGQSADLREIRALADRYGFKILEDASHAIGARYDGHYVGDGRYADITVFSFHPVKIITTAEGGLAVTNDKDLAQTMSLLSSHGITRDPALMTGEKDGAWYYQQIELGFNYRMTEMQAALGISQMARLDDYVARRAALAERYDRLLEGLPLRRPRQMEATASSWHLYIIQLHDASQHNSVFDSLRDAGVGVNLHYIPIHRQPYYQRLGFSAGDFPAAEDYYTRAISIPLFPTMTEDQQDYIVSRLRGLLTGARA
ncbi:UDP-4-amino-4,6-dideoxy-N-acetyl-beta-L-altrosamine transaminase [Hoeflea ulvae]|uniref:UDP-4-amino-4, 6-dideoxy-N-acetyl-beta-L-altrosamine transaminase n=1 Tax=Hoeflea ulvae TaxID=2983764 RepID=A0ABT3YAY3_9HYPH|nr:UDP-4-amino-4,6-dideoxy-N-acetyl-beta-L-altrosamine transaminase [Hoeflea ulvae]MCY0093038.1 UDP-4-amino-4,6-dideoxy-N-acetyl-beta-L-altrosamine transaminase [Hoeflea ulvae]